MRLAAIPVHVRYKVLMTGRVEVAITFLVYLLFFGWVGVRRGFRAELLAFLVGLIGWVVVQEFGNIFVQLANLTGKFARFAASGGLGGDSEAGFAALQAAPDIITAGNRESFLFLVWVALLVMAYLMGGSLGGSKRPRTSMIPLTPGAIVESFAGLMSGQLKTGSPAPPDARLWGWAVILGIANGLLYASVFLPRLIALLGGANINVPQNLDEANALQILGSGLRIIFDNLLLLWNSIGDQAPLALLIIITLFLVIVAGTLRGSKKNAGAKS
jgi:hypothetical protein